MGLIESIFYMLWRGIAIGIIMSAPMGPVGILCIQRTLDKGRRTGFYTGVGAALSDLFYCLLTGFGLSFIEEFLERNSDIIQLVGSIVLIGFSVYLFRKNPAKNLKKPTDPRKASKGKAILGGFLFTISNPLILFLIIGLFARFNFLMPEIKFYHYMIGFAFIFVGALLWWWMVTYFVDKVRAHFNVRSMWLVNRIIGVIILLFAVVGIITSIINLTSQEASASTSTPRSEWCPEAYYNPKRGYAPFPGASPQGVVLDNDGDSTLFSMVDVPRVNGSLSRNFTLRFKAANLHNSPGKRYSFSSSGGKRRSVENPPWSVVFTDGVSDTLMLTFATEEGDFDGVSSRTVMRIVPHRVSGNDIDGVEKVELSEGVDMYCGENIFTITRNLDHLTVAGGNHGSEVLLDFLYPGDITSSVGFAVAPGGKAIFSDISINVKPDLQSENADERILDGDFISSLRTSADPMEGIWRLFDYSLEESMLRLGGEYSLAIVCEDDGSYSVFYLEGAVSGKNQWRRGTLKAMLKPTSFPDVYDVVWRDSEGVPMSRHLKAQLDPSTSVLTISFPKNNSTLRIRKVE